MINKEKVKKRGWTKAKEKNFKVVTKQTIKFTVEAEKRYSTWKNVVQLYRKSNSI